MNKDSFWAGVGMLTLPFVLIGAILLIKALAESGINWLSALGGFCIVMYILTAIYLIGRGLSEESSSNIKTKFSKKMKGGKEAHEK